MQVGVNYPWFDYGWDFGIAPPGWRSGDPNWIGEIDQHLRHLSSLGISVVRWFILGDGLTYGAAADAPRFDDSGPTPAWRFDPPALATEFQGHFETLLDHFAAANRQSRTGLIQLLPVLLDYTFCTPGTHPVSVPGPERGLAIPDTGWVKGGRADALNAPHLRRDFLDRVLLPLLAVSQRAPPETLYAWEVINEPEWITDGWHPNPDPQSALPVRESAMRALVGEAMTMIRDAGFKATVGFARLETIAATRLYADINQFHHYTDGSRSLPRHTFDPQYPAIIGEFATSSREDRWPELARRMQGVLHRLRAAAELGYPLALPWSFRARDRHTRWSAQVERDIERFTEEHSRLVPDP